MRLNAVKVLGISVTISSKDTILEYLKKGLEKPSAVSSQPSPKSKKSIIIVTPNPEQIVLAQIDKRFAEILNWADVAIPDGVGLVAAMRLLYQKSEIKRIPGVELMEDLVAMASKRGYPVALIGGRAGVAVRAFECLRQKYPGLMGWTEEPGEMPILPISNTTNDQYYQYTKGIIEKISTTRTRIVFVGLGAPKQELLIEAVSCQLLASFRLRRSGSAVSPPIVLMSVGGAFDIIAGRMPRAPSFVRSVGLEWLWRLAREPWRWRRQLALIRFLWLIAKSRLSS
ncbi:WecB/TagA/CpsF family glycosyltransferase [Candidatus Gottesmanbacteria bacterium]|nr:WecB/TagA/CpsF family glycosyltransferase [Candidatus Gottesmanbacteria bacterium]